MAGPHEDRRQLGFPRLQLRAVDGPAGPALLRADGA
jgi:hypothetical protein